MKNQMKWMLAAILSLFGYMIVWADTTVNTDSELYNAVTSNQTVTLGDDITLTNGRLDIDGKTITLNLNGHILRRPVPAADAGGQVIFVKNGGQLTITDKSDNSGKITGGWSFQGGAIYVSTGCSLTISGGTIIGNRADQISGGGYGYGGGVENHGTMTMTGGVISNNNAQWGGGIYNAEGASLTLKGGTISGNTANMHGSGIYQWQSTVNMQGNPVVKNNTADDYYLSGYQLITVTGAFADGASIGVYNETMDQSSFTTGYSTYNPGVAPSTYFFVSSSVIAGDVVLSGNEASIQQTGYKYIERAWADTKKMVTETEKTCESYYVINGSGSGDSGWQPLINGWYVVTDNSSYDALNVMGTDVNLIIPDGVTLNVKHVKLESGKKLTIYGQSGDTGQLTANNKDGYSNAAGIGGGDNASAGTLIIHGATINATGGEKGAGIGGGKNKGFDGGLTIYGGKVTAKGGEYGAGMGSGDESPTMAGHITIYGGKVTATGGDNAAGIGGGDKGDGAVLRIYGGTINANAYFKKGDGQTTNSEGSGAGIGGGHAGNGVETYIFGGTVTAKGSVYGASIGGGSGSGYSGKGNGGYIEISGGTVNVNERSGGAAIGCGSNGESATIYISGGTVKAALQKSSDVGAAAIGGGGDYNPTLNITITGGKITATGLACQGIGAGGSGITGEYNYQGTLLITGGKIYAYGQDRAIGGTNVGEVASNLGFYNEAMVHYAFSSSSKKTKSSANSRAMDCVTHRYAAIEPCTHTDATYTVSGITANDTHTEHCAYCSTVFEPEKHTFIDGKCSVCGVEQNTYTVTVYVPADNGATDGMYEAVTYQMVPGTKFSLPASPITFSDRVFAGWLVGTVPNNSYTTRYGEELLAAGDEYTINGDVAFTARYSYIYITLADNADNSETLAKYVGKTAIQVLLRNRTLYKDGRWNTLCLPFALSDIAGTPLEGATVKTLTSAAFADGTLTLNFGDDLTAIEAGKPYIVKWTSTQGTDNLKDPAFRRVTINYTSDNVETDVVSFNGIFSPYTIEDEDRTLLYLGAGNTLYYPDGAMTIGSCRAYFRLQGDLEYGQPTSTGINNFVLNFGGGETAIRSLTPSPSPKGEGSDYWYDLHGRRLIGKPAAKGIYINNGNKYVIK